MRIFYRIATCILLGVALTCTGMSGSQVWAATKAKKSGAKAQKAKLNQKAQTPARRSAAAAQKIVAPAQLDHGAEFEILEEEVIAAINVLAVHPDDAPTAGKFAELALRTVRAAERAFSRGDDALFDRYSQLIRRRLDEARPALEAMSDRGVGAADYALGAIELHGLLGPKRLDRACRRFASALDKGFNGARFRHAQCIEDDEPERALALFREAANAGHVAAAERIGRLCLEASPPDAACAQARLDSAARGGRASATALLAWMQAEGIGGPADPALAASLYAEAARRGEASAANNLGELHESGRGVTRDEKAAFEHYLAAARNGFAPGQFNVGRLYAAGRGTTRDTGEARRWLREAEAAGIEPARRILSLLEQES